VDSPPLVFPTFIIIQFEREVIVCRTNQKMLESLLVETMTRFIEMFGVIRMDVEFAHTTGNGVVSSQVDAEKALQFSVKAKPITLEDIKDFVRFQLAKLNGKLDDVFQAA
jgi:hypothetical protein